MKKVLTILLCVACLCANAQTDREILLDISKQVTKLNEQMAVNNAKIEATNARIDVINTKIDATNTRIEALDKSVDKRLDFMQSLLIIIIPLIITSVIGIVGFVLWDRQTTIKPIQEETKKELDKLKAKEEKLEERLETALKKIAQIEPRFTSIL